MYKIWATVHEAQFGVIWHHDRTQHWCHTSGNKLCCLQSEVLRVQMTAESSKRIALQSCSFCWTDFCYKEQTMRRNINAVYWTVSRCPPTVMTASSCVSTTLKGCLMLPGQFDLPVTLDLLLFILDVFLELDRLLQLQLIWNNIVFGIGKNLPANTLRHITREHCPQTCQKL